MKWKVQWLTPTGEWKSSENAHFDTREDALECALDIVRISRDLVGRASDVEVVEVPE